LLTAISRKHVAKTFALTEGHSS